MRAIPQDVCMSTTWEYREFSFPHGTTRDEARAEMVSLAEHGYWELARVRIYPDGRRKIWLRRRVIRAVRTA